jgi:hypothetical protein
VINKYLNVCINICIEGINIEMPVTVVTYIFIGLIILLSIFAFINRSVEDTKIDIKENLPIMISNSYQEYNRLTAEEISELSNTCIQAAKSDSTIEYCYIIRTDTSLPSHNLIQSAWSSFNYPGEIDFEGNICNGKTLLMEYLAPQGVLITCR